MLWNCRINENYGVVAHTAVKTPLGEPASLFTRLPELRFWPCFLLMCSLEGSR